MLARPWRLPVWVGPVGAAVVCLVSGAIRGGQAVDALVPLRDPLAFLVVAVPLAVALDHLGVFAAIAAGVDGGRHLVAWLWVVAAAVVVVFNLDAAVVLLTPLYIRIARRHGLAPETLAFQPALVACLASGVLPVSNLTNLLAAERFDLGAGDFLIHLAAPSVAATAVGFVAYRRVFHTSAGADLVDELVDRAALRRGVPIIAFTLAGFTVGDALGVPAWTVALVALLWASAWTRRVPWREVPVSAIAVATGLAVTVAAATPHLALDRVLRGTGVLGELRITAVTAAAANVANNLPTVLAAGPALASSTHVWPVLVGVNIGAVLTLTGSLSGLLWRDTAARAGVTVSPGRYAAVGCRVGLPALLAAVAVRCLVG